MDLTDKLSMCGSVTADVDKAGVSTSRIPRVSKNSRARCSSLARFFATAGPASGRQLSMFTKCPQLIAPLVYAMVRPIA